MTFEGEGRVLVVEMLALDDALRVQIMAGAPASVLERVATEARLLRSFRRSALHLMSRQMISLAEALLTSRRRTERARTERRGKRSDPCTWSLNRLTLSRFVTDPRRRPGSSTST